jgi:hypothetical protein
MGLLVDGVWQDQWYDTGKTGGRFVRSESQFRNWITPDGTAGPTGEGGFAAEAGRYHLYISRACPWAHRTMIFRALKGLESAISFSVTHWVMAEQGWTFEPGPGVIEDTANGAPLLYEIYKQASSSYTGRVTVPVLWDKQRRTIVNNESGEIIRMHCGLRTGSDPGVHPLRHRCGEGARQASRPPGRPQAEIRPARVEGDGARRQGTSYRLIGREVGLSKNTLADIVKRHRANATQTV